MTYRLLSGLVLAFMLSVVHAAVPDIALPELDGRPRNINEFIGHGKWVIVVLWAHDCRICAKEIHNMNAFHSAHKDKDAIVLGVTIDGAELIDRARRFASNHKLLFTNLVAEPDEEVILRFGGGRFIGTPTHYFYEPKGRIVGRKIGPLSGEDVEAFIEAFNKSPHAAEQPVTR